MADFLLWTFDTVSFASTGGDMEHNSVQAEKIRPITEAELAHFVAVMGAY